MRRFSPTGVRTRDGVRFSFSTVTKVDHSELKAPTKNPHMVFMWDSGRRKSPLLRLLFEVGLLMLRCIMNYNNNFGLVDQWSHINGYTVKFIKAFLYLFIFDIYTW
eukprot:TRINITY_DN37614_c1_g1_i1.p1 TRINITY_DN37614_c1_g1~~TRINITY_DN37614_c1_g1_i1.p1  ORF type:complete len:106 (-),score=5.09 TRINITY_DN37614_c1_g1_i1:111-428(-)